MASFTINGESVEVDADPRTPLLWVIREHLKLTGTKFGCGVGQCGACTVHVDGEATFSCLMTVAGVEGRAAHGRPGDRERAGSCEPALSAHCSGGRNPCIAQPLAAEYASA